MTRPHDRGGWPTDEPIDRSDHQRLDWEVRMDALHQVLGRKGLRTTDEMRRAIESLDPELYESLSYYERWTAALEILMVEKDVLTSEEIDGKMAQLEQPGS
ncbi:MAG: nitrile hydratase subunit beta [Chloroflexi bacterium]|nr:nitrile hydratase subunit beta [Chloroflexota bacterium]MCH8348927.1 nitrile hydratase subunit beta [Chloroflexota bacterium]MCI0781237.1 nitrile hydratase subunit beta [Chloroflexota bacterium]MCI0786731.1 nitrile hydratase subunit beta [Chloroflexota bacterium]MCI0793668.1 nitrile hydratase subunit beta [Chloroflexota bacterium]